MGKMTNSILRFLEDISESRRDHVMKLFSLQPIDNEEAAPAVSLMSKNSPKY
jgi:hypothetical protein